VKLQASDVLYVPQSGTRTALIRAAEIGLVSARRSPYFASGSVIEVEWLTITDSSREKTVPTERLS